MKILFTATLCLALFAQRGTLAVFSLPREEFNDSPPPAGDLPGAMEVLRQEVNPKYY
ncbi:MAG: hypothetical protein KI790_11360 [Cyclobacteriaceae bacterium]|nr:hypothetical protein [Cyclobacteriaceae bacterium HetDA_MAG_MS6]